MANLKIELIVELDESWEMKEAQELDWFKESVMNAKSLSLHSNEVGDTIGTVKEITNWKITPSE